MHLRNPCFLPLIIAINHDNFNDHGDKYNDHDDDADNRNSNLVFPGRGSSASQEPPAAVLQTCKGHSMLVGCMIIMIIIMIMIMIKMIFIIIVMKCRKRL